MQKFSGFTCSPQICNIFPILPNMQHFPNRWSMQIFLTSEIGPDILMKVFEGYIILLITAGLLLFNFCLKQKQVFGLELYWNYLHHLQQKQKTKVKKKILTQWILGFTAIHFFNRNQVFLNFQSKQAVRKLSAVNFNYTYRLHLVLVIRISLDKNLIYPEIQAARILMKQKIILIVPTKSPLQ